MEPSQLNLWVPGKPRGQGRPRAVRRGNHAGVHKAKEDEQNEQWIEACWLAEGKPRLEGAISLTIAAYFDRPKGHYLKDGSLSAPGRRAAFYTSKPDGDNILKAVCDALNGRAWADDAQIIRATVTKNWSGRAGAGIRILAYELDL